MRLLKPASCRQCLGWQWGRDGFVPADGTGDNGVLVVLEAAGEDEANSGTPTVGRAGYYFWSQLKRVGIDRDGFRIHNVLSCQPPRNLLSKMPYEHNVIASCAPNLDATIVSMRNHCQKIGKVFTILTLGKIAFKRILHLPEQHSLLRVDYYCYPIYSDEYEAWVIAAPHPSYLMRGNNHQVGILQFAAQRALEIAENGLVYDNPQLILDPEPVHFEQWVQAYEHTLAAHPDTTLAFDIETPYKKGSDEATVSREEDEDYTILRCSFAYNAQQAVSVPWRAEYKPLLEQLFSSAGAKVGHNSDNYDIPRIAMQMPVHGDHHDTMLMWHVLNSALPKGLGFVTPYYWQTVAPWKHLADTEPAKYNALDSLATWHCYRGIQTDLRKENLYRVYDRHVVELNRVLNYMSERGVLRDNQLRDELEGKLSKDLEAFDEQMQTCIPQKARKLKVFKKTPKATEGLVQIDQQAPVKRCSICGLENPKKAHFKPVSARKAKLGLDNVCEDAEVIIREETVKRWARAEKWHVSKAGLEAYQKALKHRAIIDRRDHKITFDSNAIEALQKKYPNDPLYKLILEYRKRQKLLTVYVGTTQKGGWIRGGLPIGKDGRIHSTYSHNPSTLRLANQNPNLQQIPNRSKEGREIRNLIIAPEGHLLVECDFSAIEAVLVGFFAADPTYIRLAKMGIHSYLSSHVLGRPADLSWSDKDLVAYFKEIKKSKDEWTQNVYNGCKRAVHLSGYGGTPRKMVIAEPEIFQTIEYAEKLQGMYFELFPAIRKWQLACQLQAEKDGYLRNPFNYVHRFNRVFAYENIGGRWERVLGDDANKVLAFLPQSTAAGIIKEAMLRLYFKRFEEAGQYLRLQVHDSLVCEVPKELLEMVLAVIKEEMTRPVPELRLPTSYGMGEALAIGVESKVGSRWGECQ